jgi:hypothetical protein
MQNTEITIEEDEPKTRIQEILENQDLMQKINVYMALVFEMYRVLMGSFLVVFVPQDCNGQICTLFENVSAGNSLYDITFYLNIVTFFSFICMYYAEVKRENKLIAYLHVSPDLPTDNENVAEVLDKLCDKKRGKILSFDKLHQRLSYIAMSCFSVNTGFSALIMKQNYLDNKTLTVFMTNVLFMALKLKDVYMIARTEKNIFYSSYLTEKVQFNDIDPDNTELNASVHSDTDTISDITDNQCKIANEKLDIENNVVREITNEDNLDGFVKAESKRIDKTRIKPDTSIDAITNDIKHELAHKV